MLTDDVGNVTPLQRLQQQMIIMNGLIFNNRSLKKHIKELSPENENIYDMLYSIEIQSNNLDQYSRRSNIEISKHPRKYYTKKFRKVRTESDGINWNQSTIIRFG